MNTVIIILLAVAGIVALLLVIAMFTKKEYTVEREISINAPLQKVFEYVKHIKNQDNYSKWVMADPDMKKEFKGADGNVGFIYAWNGNKKAGEGEQEIKAIAEGEKVLTEVRIIRPFKGVVSSYLKTTAVSANQTVVKWGHASKIIFPMNIMVSMIKNMLSKDIDTSLAMLKSNLEK